jgi:hypothetical protein
VNEYRRSLVDASKKPSEIKYAEYYANIYLTKITSSKILKSDINATQQYRGYMQ